MVAMVKMESLYIESEALSNNPLKDPAKREILVFSPDEKKANAPLFLCLPSFASNARSFLNKDPLSDNLPAILQMLYEKNLIGNATVAIVDSFTKVGGNQYVNSTAVGNYEDFIINEVIPKLKDTYNSGNVGVFGKDSGGFGAYTLSVRYPSVIQGFAAHSMDAGFEFCYLPDFTLAMEQFRESNGPAKWLQKYWAGRNRSRSNAFRTLSVIEKSLFYSPNESSSELGADFPFDWYSGEFNQDIWSKWQNWDPAKNAVSFLRQIESMSFLYLDVGIMDEFSLLWGNRAVDKALTTAGIKHFYEEYEDGHFGIVYRFEKSLTMMAAALSL